MPKLAHISARDGDESGQPHLAVPGRELGFASLGRLLSLPLAGGFGLSKAATSPAASSLSSRGMARGLVPTG